jgi:uncharacterized protein involved in outer membrane biogenesis
MTGKSILRRWSKWLYALLALAAYALAGFLLAPYLVERTLKSTLSERLSLETELDSLGINPFTLTLIVDGLQVTQADSTPVLAFERLFVNFEMMSLFRWAWTFGELHLIQPAVRFERLSESETNIGALITAWSTNAGGTPPANDDQNQVVDDLLRLIIADLRIVDGRLTVIDRVPAEPFSTDVAPINLQVTDLSTLPDAEGNQQVTIALESGAEVAWTGSLTVNPLALSGQLRMRGTYTPMIFRYFQDELDLPVTFDGGEVTSSLAYVVTVDDGGGLEVAIDDLSGTLTGLAINQPDFPQLMEIGSFNVAGGELRWPDKTLHVDDIHFDRVSINAFRLADGSYLPSSGQSPTPPPPLVTEVDDSGWQLSAGQLRFTNWSVNHTDTTINEGLLEIQALNLTLRELSNAEGQSMPVELSLAPTAGGRIAANGTLQFLPLPVVEISLDAQDLALRALQPYLTSVANIDVASGNLTLSGSFVSSGDIPARYDGSLAIEQLELTDRIEQEALFSWERLDIDRMVLAPESLALSSLTLDAPYARIEIETDGSTNIERTLIDEDSTDDPDSADQEGRAGSDEGAGPIALSIGEIKVNDATARFTDLALPLPFEANVSALNGALSALDSASNEPARLSMSGQVNEYGQVQIDGLFQPFRPASNTDLEIRFENVNLPRMSPYTIKFAGRRIADGRTDLTLGFRLNDGQLEGDNHLVIRDLTLGEKVAHPDAMDLPLDLAVALLKDPSGTVDFNFPVSGSLDDPEFSYSGAVAKAFSNMVLGLATAPFRLLGSLVGLKASDVDNVGFEPGTATLSPPQKETLVKLAEALEQRPQLKLSLAPVTAPVDDRHALATAQVNADIEATLTEMADEATDALITERLSRVLATMYEAALLAPALEELKAQHAQPDENGRPQLDLPAYNASLRDALISHRVIPESELDDLASKRAVAISSALTDLTGLAGERIRLLPAVESKLNDDGLVVMPLEVTTEN